MLKAIALDMDNTLLNSNKEISVTNRDVLRYLNRKGIRVILCWDALCHAEALLGRIACDQK